MASFTVLGAAGFVGGHLVEHLRRNGHDVWAPDRDDPSIYQRDLGHVVYCIGVVRDRVRRLFDTAEAHACKLAQVLERAHFRRLVYLSTTRLYDGIEGVADETAEFRLDPQKFGHFYLLSKAFGETLVYHTGKNTAVARLANVYDDRLARQDFLCTTVRRALDRNLIEIDSDPTAGRDYIHVDDVCRALERIALEARHSVYNVATGSVLTNQRLAELCDRALGCRLVFRARDAAKPPPTISIGRLERDFDIHPRPAVERLGDIVGRLRKDHHAA
jgi:nucleoside-diphosphate-sugar epimerase